MHPGSHKFIVFFAIFSIFMAKLLKQVNMHPRPIEFVAVFAKVSNGKATRNRLTCTRDLIYLYFFCDSFNFYGKATKNRLTCMGDLINL